MGTSIHFRRLLGDLDPRRPTPLYEQIASRIRVAIATGELAPHTALPSVRQLATTLRINPSTVVSAYRELESDGFVYAKRGSGTFVAGLSPEGRSEERQAHAERLVDVLLEDAARLGLPAEVIAEALERRIRANDGVVAHV